MKKLLSFLFVILIVVACATTDANAKKRVNRKAQKKTTSVTKSKSKDATIKLGTYSWYVQGMPIEGITFDECEDGRVSGTTSRWGEASLFEGYSFTGIIDGTEMDLYFSNGGHYRCEITGPTSFRLYGKNGQYVDFYPFKF